MKKLLLLTIFLNSFLLIAQSPCTGMPNPTSGGYPCDTLELHGTISASGMSALEGQDSWGWVDPLDGTEYALVALDDGTAFIRLDSSSSPTTLEYIVKMDTHTGSSYWRDVKVYGNYAYVVSDSNGSHGVQIFDLTRLRTEFAPVATRIADERYSGIGSAHNIIIDEENGFLYILGSSANGGGPRIMDLTDPLVPTVAGNISAYGYCHDAQVITYNGPDTEHHGKQILIGSFSGADYVRVLDVTTKNSVTEIGTGVQYSNRYYTHQGWFTHDQRFFIVGDEVDEENIGGFTRTFVFDMADLDNPVLHYTYFGATTAIDHNGYIKGNKLYLANYAAGARVIDISGLYDPTPSMTEIQYFDTYTPNNSANFHGVWNVYPFFESGNLVVSGFGNLNTNGDGGVFIVKDPNYDAVDPVAICQNISVTLDAAGQATITAAQIDNGSTDNVVVYDMWLDKTTFDCKNLGTNTVTLTVIDGNENKSTCTATVTVNPSATQTTTTYNGAWDNGVPDANMKAVFTANYNTSNGDIEACSCDVASGATVIVANGDYMKIGGDITVDGTLAVRRTGSVVQISDNATVTNNGAINVNLRTPALNARDFVILGNPMTMSDESVFTDVTAAYQVLNHTTDNFTPYVGVPPVVGVNFHDQESNDWSNFSGTLTPGEGYFVRPSYTADATYNYTYNQGTLNNGAITYAADFGDDKEDSPSVLANPYASAIDADVLISSNPIVDEMYFWQHNTTPGTSIPGPLSENFNMEDISTYNGTMGIAAASGGTAPTNVIGTGQGFGIKANAAGDVTFNNAMRLTSNEAIRQTVEKDLIWIGVKENTYNMGSTAGIGFLKYASDRFDRGYDTQKLGTVVSLYSHLPDGSGQFGIQGREVFDANITIPMGFSTLIEADAGIPYVISIEKIEGANIENTTIYLVDNLTNITTNLSTDRYEFLSGAGTFNNRFTLQFERVLSSDPDIVEDSLRVFPNPTANTVTIQYPDATIEKATLFDSQGRMLLEKSFEQRLDLVQNSNGNGNGLNEFYTLDLSKYNSAIYFIQFKTSNGTITKQVVKE